MGSTKVESPTPPAAPTAVQNMQGYISTYPQLFQLQQEYAPKEAQMNMDLVSEYALPYATAMKEANDALYPETSLLQEQMATQAREGMEGGVPDWLRDKYRSEFNAGIGTNVGSGMGSQYVADNLLNQDLQWQQYYNNLGLSLAGRQPLAMASQPGYTNQLGGYTAQGVAQTNAQNYGNYSNLYGNMYNTNAQTAQAGNPYFNAVAGLAGTALGGWAGNGFQIGGK